MPEEKEESQEKENAEVQDQPKAVPEPTALIDAANKAAERLEKGNEELKKLLEIQQKAIIEKTLSGETVAGTPAKTKEEQQQENAENMLKGTGMEEYAFPKAKTDSSYN